MNLYWLATTVIFISSHAKEIPDSELNITQIYTKYGYPAEIHEVQTEDGYILGLFRVPHGRSNSLPKNTSRYPVLLMHGLLGSAENFMYLGPDKSLSYMLADRGYDVWLGNARGNTHSRKHVTLDPDRDKRKFWDFSWHEIGVYDLPATIDYILDKTGQSNLFYYGHSQGTTSFFVMTSSRPDYNKKIRLMVALAPVVFMKHITFFLKGLAKHHVLLDRIFRALNLQEFVPLVKNDQLRNMFKILCGTNSGICKKIFGALLSNDAEQLDEAIIPFVMSTVPAGASSFQLLHYAQGIARGTFRQYDFGEKKNLKKYKANDPPDYNLKNVVAPIALFYSVFDDFSAVVDVEKLSRILPNVVEYYKIPWDKFTHLDYLVAKDSDTLFINKGLALMEKFKDI